MPARLCKCGNKLDYSNIPNSIEWLTISDEKFDTFPSNMYIKDLLVHMETILKCEKCKRLYIYWNGFNHPAECYIPDDNDQLAQDVI